MKTNKAIIRKALEMVAERPNYYACIALARAGASKRVVECFQATYGVGRASSSLPVTFTELLARMYPQETVDETIDIDEVRVLTLAFFLVGYKDFL